MKRMRGAKPFERVAPLLSLALLLLACGPAGGPSTDRPTERVTAGQTVEKVVRIAHQTEPEWLVRFGRVTGQTFTAGRFFIWHGSLTYHDYENRPIAHAAVKVPAVSDGDWVVNPDGTMRVKWQIRPDVYWHDGAPLTSADFVFGWEVINNPQLVIDGLTLVQQYISGVEVVDDKSFYIRWKAPSFYGNDNSRDWIPAIPKHALEADYRSMDAVAFDAHPAWRDQLLGIGPYKVVRWEQGSFVESVANERFFLGRPRIGRLILSFIPDQSVMVANLLAGAIDLAPTGSQLKPDQLVALRQQWGPSGGQVWTNLLYIRRLSLNMNEPAPWVADVRFRQAMLMSIDKAQLAEVLQYGMTEPAAYFVQRQDPVRALVERAGVPKFEHNPTEAARLFAQSGWTKGPDGLLRNSAGQSTGAFYCCRYLSQDQSDARESQAWGDGMKSAGIEVVHPIPNPPPQANATETRKAQQFNYGAKINNWFMNSREHYANLLSTNIPSDANRWVGPNTVGYANPVFDALFSQRMGTLGVPERQQVEVQMVKMIQEELFTFPVYYNPLGSAMRAGLKGPASPPDLNGSDEWNIHTWEIV